MKLYVQTYAEEPALPDAVFPAVKQRVWPEFMFHDPIAGRLWKHLEHDFAAYQFVLRDADAGDCLVAVAHTLPFHWEGPLPDDGWDGIFEKVVADLHAGLAPNTLTAIEASIAPEYQNRGVSRIVLEHMRAIAQRAGFGSLVAPVRPSWKSRYPHTPIDRYVAWAHDASGAPFDPWLRAHWRLGARIEKIAPRSMTIPGTVAQWESWAGMRFPDSGEYVVPGALNSVHIDRERDEGIYVEPNVWMRHGAGDQGDRKE
ncbi:MAG: GNAT family N-acetyltransferase [Chloroflexi bacterium]|nr:GNAT family N-acetyltransferase [Chloroflexota bacterium]